MLCQTCHTHEATVHISSVLYAPGTVEAHHFCRGCAEAAETSNPVWTPTTAGLPPVHTKPVTGLAAPARVRVQSIETRLAQLDPLWEAFCSRRGYRFVPGRELWPNRGAVAHAEIARQIVLTMDVPFPTMLERGFFAEMPWSLNTMATLPFFTRKPPKPAEPAPPALPSGPRPILTFELFRQLPFSQLGEVLNKQLERAFSLLSEVTREDVLRKGEIPQGRLKALQFYPW